MTRKQRYFIKQKLIGILVLLLAVLTIYLLDGDATVAIFLIPAGIAMIVTKHMLIVDSYYIHVMEEKKKHKKRF